MHVLPKPSDTVDPLNPVGTRFLVLVILSAVLGCGASDGRQSLSGSVTLDGQPMPEGAVSFRPTGGTTGPSSGGTIQQGKFNVPATKGLMPGEYQVGIICMRETGRIIDDPQKGKVPELVQVRFQQLPANVIVSADKPNDFSFELRSISSPQSRR